MTENNLPKADVRCKDNPKVMLEYMFISAYLNTKGYTLETIQELSLEEIKKIMTEACTFASVKLAEIETRAHFVQDMHDAMHLLPS